MEEGMRWERMVGEGGEGDEVKRVGERGFCLVQLNFNLKP